MSWALDRALAALERVLLALVRVRAAVLRRRRRLPAGRCCRVCGCVDAHACIEITVCDWIEPDLCSSCGAAVLEVEEW